MSDKERLENIRPKGFDLNGNVLLKSEDYHWLMERAERVEELEKELNEWQNEALRLFKLFEEYQELNKRYREALEFYANEKSWMNREVTILMDGEPTDVEDCPAIFDDGGNIARKALDGKRMSDKECEEFVCDYCGTELDETDEYHTTFHTCDKDCYMKMVGLSWGDFI